MRLGDKKHTRLDSDCVLGSCETTNFCRTLGSLIAFVVPCLIFSMVSAEAPLTTSEDANRTTAISGVRIKAVTALLLN